jgi:hypothetical protein
MLLPAPAIVAATDKARTVAIAAEQAVTQLVAKDGQLKQRYADELAAIDRLKNQKRSWRRDRELGASLADSAETAKQLESVAKELAAAQATLVVARRAWVAAIDVELGAGAVGPRAQTLAKLRGQLAPQVGPAPKKIIVPDAEIDPLADPEELDQQVAQIRATEAQLARQINGLETQATELIRIADLRGAHQRATDLALREDDQPHRTAQHSTSRGFEATAATPGAGGDGAGQGAGGAGGAGGGSGTSNGSGASGGGITDLSTDHTPSLPGGSSAFEAQLTVVLGDVIDHSMIDSLVRASRSGDPAQRADAAKQARDAVEKRLEMLKKKRAAIEARAKALRKAP